MLGPECHVVECNADGNLPPLAQGITSLAADVPSGGHMAPVRLAVAQTRGRTTARVSVFKLGVGAGPYSSTAMPLAQADLPGSLPIQVTLVQLRDTIRKCVEY